jgi:hypothetical protein
MSMTEVSRPARVWTPEMDEAITSGYAEGKSARLIGEQLGVSRNSVLGRTFRLGLCNSYSNPREPTETATPKLPRASLVEKANKLRVVPSDIIDRIIDLRELGVTWQMIANELEVSTPTARLWGIKSGVLYPKTHRKFSSVETAYIIEAWNRSDPLEDIAEKCGRTFGTMRQQIMRLQRKGDLGTRDPARTRLLKQYGEAALAAGATPTEALIKIRQAKEFAFASAVKAARDAKRKYKDGLLETMRAALAAGEDRDAAIFAARAGGCNLEEIAKEFDITRERVRQICNAHAQSIVLKGLVA